MILGLLSKIGLVDVKEYNWHDQHILDYENHFSLPHIEYKKKLDPYRPRPLVVEDEKQKCGVPTADGWENWHIEYNQKLGYPQVDTTQEPKKMKYYGDDYDY